MGNNSIIDDIMEAIAFYFFCQMVICALVWGFRIFAEICVLLCRAARWLLPRAWKLARGAFKKACGFGYRLAQKADEAASGWKRRRAARKSARAA